MISALSHYSLTDGDLRQDISGVVEALPGSPAHLQPEVRLEGRLVELELQVGVGKEEVLHPVVG